MGYIVVAGVVVVVALLIGRIVAGGRARTQRNAGFLANALAAQDLSPSTSTQVSVPLVAGAPHAIWLELEVTGGSQIAFQVALALQVGGTVVLDGTYPVTFDDEEHDARGLPNPPGVSALNTSVAALPGRTRITTTLRAFRFDAPAASTQATIRATLEPGAGVSFQRTRLLVTSPDAPPGSGELPAGMRAIS